MACDITTELERFGIDRVEFEERIRELKFVMFPCWSDEELTFHPEDEAMAYVRAVRAMFQAPDLADDLIFRTLIGVRKNKKRRE